MEMHSQQNIKILEVFLGCVRCVETWEDFGWWDFLDMLCMYKKAYIIFTAYSIIVPYMKISLSWFVY